MVRDLAIGLAEALRLTLERIAPLETELLPLADCVDRVAGDAMAARVDSPSVDASLKDGYAVLSGEVAGASAASPVCLKLLGSVAAGAAEDIPVRPGTTVRVLTGARIPSGADAVVAEEFARPAEGCVHFLNFAEPGRNILPRGCDVAAGSRLALQGDPLSPGRVGLLAAAGLSRIPVVRRPRVAIVATGDEVVAPGRPLPDGKLYASNLTTLAAWCQRYRLETRMAIVGDDPAQMTALFQSLLEDSDAIVTSGGAWTGDRDMVAKILAALGWTQVFHRIRIGPGKAVGFGLLAGKPVFILPGGPPSNLMGFLQIALPGLLRLAGQRAPGLPLTTVRLALELVGAHADWTQFIFGRLAPLEDRPLFHPLRGASRLGAMAEAEAVVAIPEGQTRLPAGSLAPAQLLV